MRKFLLYTLAILGALGLLLGGYWVTRGERQQERLLELAGLYRSPLETAEAGLLALQKQQELTVYSARFLIRASRREPMLSWLPEGWFDSSKTLLVAGTVRYVVELSELAPDHLSYDVKTQTLTVVRPPVRISRPRFHVENMEQEKNGGFIMWLTNSERVIDRRNWQAATDRAMQEARNPTYVEIADRHADETLARLFRLSLIGAGHEDVHVVVHTADGANEAPTPAPLPAPPAAAG